MPEAQRIDVDALTHDIIDSLHYAATFVPDPDVDYGWIVDYAKRLSDGYDTTAKTLDEKAQSVLNYLGSATGLLTFGSVLSLAADKISPWIGVAMLPAVGCALTSICFALRTRSLRWTTTMPHVKDAIEMAEYFGDKGQAAFLPQWDTRIKQMRKAMSLKADDLAWSFRFFYAAIVALLLPFLVAICFRFAAPPVPAPPAGVPYRSGTDSP